MITVIGPNPAVDHILDVPGFVPGASWRSQSSLHVAGGKPMNVARTLRRLDVEVLLACPVGGKLDGSQLIAEACQHLGIELCALPIAPPIRTCVVLVDTENTTSSVINEPGPHLSAEEAGGYERLAMDSVCAGNLALGSGSLPPGIPTDFYGRVARCARERGIRLILDTTGEALVRALESRPWAVKVNGEEIVAATGAPNIEQAVADVTDQGVEHVVVTLGADGARYFGPDAALRISTAPVRTVNPVGSGDAFLAGLSAGLNQGYCWADALRLASAVGGLAASRFEPDIGPSPDLAPLLEQVKVSAQ